MANIKISELNELETKNSEDLLAIVDTNNNETKKIKVETLAPENFELELIADEEPEHGALVQGECYYNTTTNKIYRYVGGGVYLDLGEPKTGILYIIFSDKATFAYDGETMVSVGGGSGETITQQPTAPENPEENDLWIDTTNGNALKRYNGTSWELVSTSSDAPIGTITPFAGTTPPSDYLLCDGTAVSRTTYSDLFAVIGTTYGSGDGSTTFNLPNLKGKVPVGLDGTQTEFDTLGETGGSKYLQYHTHQLTGGSGSMYYTAGGENAWVPKADKNEYKWGSDGPINVTTGNSGNLQPYIVTNFIIKATKTTPISSEVVNTFSNSTKNAYSCDYVNEALVETYSTDEVKTNKVWIDGKPIYRKVISVNSPSSAGVYTTIANMGSNVVNTLVSATSMILVSYAANNKVFYNLNIDEGDANHYCLIAYNQSNGNIQAKVGTAFINNKITIVLEYTKTTD